MVAAVASGATRDLQGLFDLELDTEKNQYESAQANAVGRQQQQKEIDDACRSWSSWPSVSRNWPSSRSSNQQTASQQRWQQEMLRREAEEAAPAAGAD